jgi:hypothetical protein
MHPTLKISLHCAVDNTIRRVPLVLHCGAAGSMLVAGEERWSRYLPDRFFGSGPRESRHLGSYWTWQLPRVLRRWRDAADITVARADRVTARLLPADEYLRVPEWIRMVAPVPASDDDILSRDAKTAMRTIRKNGLTWRITHDPAELETYIARDYEPYISRRYGADAYVRPRRWLRTRFRSGGLLWVEQSGVPIAGLLFEMSGGFFLRLTTACVNADDRLLRIGATHATYLFGFHAARSFGLAAMDLLGCRPCLHDGLFRYKRKWGGAVADKPDTVYDLLVRWNTATPAVIRFLAESPLIFRDGDGFSAIDTDRVTPRQKLLAPGLRRLVTLRPDAAFGACEEDRGDELATDR